MYVARDFGVNNTLELAPITFIADEDSIFGKVDRDYVEKEIEWYNTRSLWIRNMRPPIPKIWEEICSKTGHINSNYGYLIYSNINHNQYDSVLECLKKDPTSRRGTMIYMDPYMHQMGTRDGKNDFVCTHAVTYLIRCNRLNAHVMMRSNDAVYGYKNDLAWQQHVLAKLHSDLSKTYPGLKPGVILWTATSLHIYERHFYLVEKAYECDKQPDNSNS